MAAVFKES